MSQGLTMKILLAQLLEGHGTLTAFDCQAL